MVDLDIKSGTQVRIVYVNKGMKFEKQKEMEMMTTCTYDKHKINAGTNHEEYHSLF